MNTINLGGFNLDFQYDFIKLKFNDGSHFSDLDFQKYFALKTEIYGNRKIGLLIVSDDETSNYSIDPMILINHESSIQENIDWLIVVSNKEMDYKNYEYFQKLTNIPCKFVNNFNTSKKERI